MLAGRFRIVGRAALVSAEQQLGTSAELSPKTVRRWRRFRADEHEQARAYRELASRRGGEEREILLGLAAAEERHAAYWERLLGDQADPPRRGTVRMRLLASLARRFGWVFVLALAQHAETRTRYKHEAGVSRTIAADDRIHAEVVRGLAARGRAQLSGTLRAAVFGANDGAVSNMALVLGVIGGGASAQTVVLTGLAGLMAGALSMAAGEYVSVSSQREILAASTPDDTTKQIVADLDVDVNELALVYRARGMSTAEADDRARRVLRHEPVGAAMADVTDDSADVVGSGVRAASASFAFFCIGAVIPVLAFLFGMEGVMAVVVAGALTGSALLLTGAAVGVLSGVSPLRRALRQLIIGAAAAAVTYLLGLAVGATIT
ncbi:VIT1/CCC1 transporter family protein [Haloechinothrix salitolerans]